MYDAHSPLSKCQFQVGSNKINFLLSIVDIAYENPAGL